MDRFMMCRPDFFGVDYIINPWMQGNIGKVDVSKAKKQWETLYAIIAQKTGITLTPPEKGLPDMVFTANSGIVFENEVILSRFLHKQRAGE